MNKLISIWSRDKIDIIAALFGILLGIAISSLNLIYSNEYIITIGPILVIVCLVYLLFRRKLLDQTSDPLLSNRFASIASILFWILLAASTYCLGSEPLHRPLSYFILISLCASMIAIQILCTQGKTNIWLILIEILLVSLSVRASAYWVFPSIPGSDPWAHLVYLKAYIDNGHIPSIMPVGVGGSYLNYPIMHLSSAMAKLITGTDYKGAMFIANSLPALLSIPFIFLIVRAIIDIRCGLLATLLVGLCDFHIALGTNMTANCIAMSFFLAILYLFAVRSWSVLRTFMLLLFFFVLIITHTMSSFVVAVVLVSLFGGIYIYKILYNERSSGSITIIPVLLFGIAMLSYWIFAGYVREESFFSALVGPLFDALTEKAGFFSRNPSSQVQYGYLSPILNILGFISVLSFGILGVLIQLSQKYRDARNVSIAITLLMLFAILFSFPAIGLRNVMPYRWFYFIYPILVIFAARGILTLINWSANKKIGTLLMLCIILTVTFFMSTNSVSNTDSPVYAYELNQRMVYLDSEMAIAERVKEVYNGTIITDHQYGTKVLKAYMGIGNVSNDMTNEKALNKGLVIWRDEMTERPVQAPLNEIILGDDFKQKIAISHNLVYSNSTSLGFLARVK